jgi:uncharacterized protein (TIGR00725 family)
MATRSIHVAVVGPGTTATAEHIAAAREVGSGLAKAGAVVLTGGHGGVMQAASAGARAAGGSSIAILPEGDRAHVNPDATYSIPTGLGELRNGLLVRAADAVVCIALSWGTLSEVALAVRGGTPVVVLGGWVGPLEGPVDAATPQQAAATALELARARTTPAQDPRQASLPVHHVTLTVTDVHRSAAWYQRLIGPAETVQREGPGWHRIRMQWPSGLVIGVTAHEATAPRDRFVHTRVGLDHVGLLCSGEAAVRAWAARLDSIGAVRGPVEDVPYGWAVTGRDPDDIPVEFFAAK